MELGELSRVIGHPWSVLWPKVRKLEERKDVGRALDSEEERRLLECADARRSPVFGCFIRVALSTGMRCGEIRCLTWNQIDFASEVITVGRAKTSNGTGRQIPINEDLKRTLLQHADWYTRTFGSRSPDHFLFPFGKPMPSDPTRPITSVKTIWKEVRKQAGVRCRLHDLRHTAATKMAEGEASESTMLSLLGHMSRSMLERYSHIRMAAKRQAVAALGLPEPVRMRSTQNSPQAISGE
ncbi:MAG: site-specific integrase [Acidobacteriaceae bacterium]|nr:site-specific integrase [Acidobacteriaceae bacterium]